MKKVKKRVKIGLKQPISPQKKIDSSVTIFDVPIFGTHKSEVLRKVGLQRKEMLHVTTVNPEFVMEARKNERFRSILAQSLTVADGYGIVWATQILHGRIIDRISGGDLVTYILNRANESHEKIFLLGAQPGVAERAAAAMLKRYPGIRIATYSGAQTVAVEKSEEASMTIARINAYSPDYLLVAYGSPWQDIWIEENRPYLRARVAIGIGGLLDEWAGVVSVCPDWIDHLGLKWLWRLVHEPSRFRRILSVWHFGLLVLYHKLID